MITLSRGWGQAEQIDEQLVETNPDYSADTAKDYELNWPIWLFQAEGNVTGANFALCMASNITIKKCSAFLTQIYSYMFL